MSSQLAMSAMSAVEFLLWAALGFVFWKKGLHRRFPAMGSYVQAHTRAWSDKIKSADAVLFVTPQYNWGYPAVLKNAIDSVFVSFALRNKPMAAVSYSGAIAGGSRAIEHLALIVIEAEMVPLRNTLRAARSQVSCRSLLGIFFSRSASSASDHCDATLAIEWTQLNTIRLPISPSTCRIQLRMTAR